MLKSVCVGLSLLLVAGAHTRHYSAPNPRIVFNDNRAAAGVTEHRALRLALVAEWGTWQPFGADKPGIPLLAFGEPGKAPEDPGPMIRVPLGTTVHVTLQNRTRSAIVVHGLAARHVQEMDTLVVAAGATRAVQFVADAPGTFYYWASTHGEDFEHRDVDDAHLNGALIVDTAGSAARPDRVFLIEHYTPRDLADGGPDRDHDLFTINGRPWPETERLTYAIGDSVRWRIINASNDVHPLHLHGFFYRVEGRGDLARDTIYWPAQQRTEVTELMLDGTTMNMAWSPDRPGAWIFHCHLNFHVVPNTGLVPDTEPSALRVLHLLEGYPDQAPMNHAMTGMGGLALGIYVRPSPGWHDYTGARRTLRLLVQSDSAAGFATRRFGYVLQDGNHVPAPDSVNVPGTPIILHRGEPTRIWVVNHTPEMTQVHWHGLEIESFYDGVAGLSGVHPAVAPPIMPGDSFAVLVTPHRTGTYIYHTHINDIRQQTHGLYGALLVIDSASTWNPDTDRIFVIGENPAIKAVLNGTTKPAAITLRPDVQYRFRLINITVERPEIHVSLARTNGVSIPWVEIAKDAAALPPWQVHTVTRPAPISIGETYDYRVQFSDTATVALDVSSAGGNLLLRQLIHVRR